MLRFKLIRYFFCIESPECINIKILNAGAWSRSSDKVAVTLPPELEDYIPEVEKFYKNEYSGRKLTWHHLMSNGVVIHTTDNTNYFY